MDNATVTHRGVVAFSAGAWFRIAYPDLRTPDMLPASSDRHLSLPPGPGLHPATRVVLCLSCGLVIQAPEGWMLAIPLLLLVAMSGAWPRFRGLVRRTRWLLLTLVGVLLVATPGLALFPEIGAWPTREGLLDALQHLLRFLAFLMLTAWLLHTSPPADLARGLLVLLAPLGTVGERFAGRLLLVLRYVEALPAERRWLAFLQDQGELDAEVLTLPAHPLAGRDRLLLVLAPVVALCLVSGEVWGR